MRSFSVGIKAAATPSSLLLTVTAVIEDNYQYMAWVRAAIPLCLVWILASLAVCSSSALAALSSIFQECQIHVAMYTAPTIQQNTSRTKTFISLICLRPPYLQVCLPRSLHLLACITSCLSHYLPFCISVCPPASAPLLRPQRDIILFSREKTEDTMVFFLPSCLAFICSSTI